MTAIGSDNFTVFGTTAVLLLTDPAAVGPARKIMDVELAAVDEACSRFRPDSELTRLNNSSGQLTAISQLLAGLIAAALRAAEATDGAVDPTCGQALVAAGYDRDIEEVKQADPHRPIGPGLGPVPGWRKIFLDTDRLQARLDNGAQLDLGATAKAWAADRCASMIAGGFGCGVLVGLGGDIAVSGVPIDGGWRVKVTDDHAAPDDARGQTVSISSGGLATSSTTVRTWTADGRTLHHIIDPATGEPVLSPWRTVSVAAATCVDANTAATAAIVMRDRAPDWLSRAGLPARLVAQDGAIQTTPGWPL